MSSVQCDHTGVSPLRSLQSSSRRMLRVTRQGAEMLNRRSEVGRGVKENRPEERESQQSTSVTPNPKGRWFMNLASSAVSGSGLQSVQRTATD